MTHVLLITSNGWGLGHLIRQLEIAKALPSEVPHTILTLSGGAAVTGLANLEYAPSYSQPWIRKGDWHGGYLKDRIVALASEVDATHIVFDGVVPYLGLLNALRDLNVYSIWMRRGLWRTTTDPKPLKDSIWFDLILEPGDIADSLDFGPTATRADAKKIGIITGANPETALSRADAARELGVDPNRPTLLLNLGSSETGELAPLIAVLNDFPDWQILNTKDELGRSQGIDPNRVKSLSGIFPLHPYLNAVDLAITSIGYNAAHEFVTMQVPAIYVPAPNLTDDQTTRGQAIAKLGAGWTIAANQPTSLARQLQELLQSPDSIVAARIRCSEISRDWNTGALTAAREVLACSHSSKPGLLKRSRLNLRTQFELRLGNLLRRQPRRRYSKINLTSEISSELIRNETPFEHVLPNTSAEYLQIRKALSQKWLIG